MQCFPSRDHPFSTYAHYMKIFKISPRFLNIDTTSFSVLTIDISNIHRLTAYSTAYQKSSHFICIHGIYPSLFLSFLGSWRNVCMQCLFRKERIEVLITITSTFCFEYNSVQALRKLVDDHSFCYHRWMRLKQNTISNHFSRTMVMKILVI